MAVAGLRQAQEPEQGERAQGVEGQATAPGQARDAPTKSGYLEKKGRALRLIQGSDNDPFVEQPYYIT